MIVSVVIGGIVRASSVKTSWGFAFVSVEAVLICIVKCGKCMKPCNVSMTTLFFLIDHKHMVDLVNLFITTKCSVNVLSQISSLSAIVANGFSNWLVATCYCRLGGSSILSMLFGAYPFFVSNSLWAITLPKTFESTRTSIVRLFSKSRSTYRILCFRFRFTVEVSGRYKLLISSILTNLSLMCGVVMMRRGMLASLLRVVIMWFPDSSLSV